MHAHKTCKRRYDGDEQVVKEIEIPQFAIRNVLAIADQSRGRARIGAAGERQQKKVRIRKSADPNTDRAKLYLTTE
jgi:hypothetical protein